MHSCDDCVAVNCPSKSNVQLNAVYVHHFITMVTDSNLSLSAVAYNTVVVANV